MTVSAGRVAIVSGSGGGIGRAIALEFARQGVAVVVNDLGTDPRGQGGSSQPANQVVDEIEALGGRAVANFGDVADWDAAGAMVDLAVETFGRLDVVVNNAGILRDRMLTSMSPDDFDQVMRVHLRGTFALSARAARHWREQAKAGELLDARIVNTTSSSGLFGNVGQSNYAAAKAGIAAMTIVCADELAPYGVTVNAVYPTAMSRLTENVLKRPAPDDFDPYDPANIAPAVVWLCSPNARHVTGRVFGVRGGRITVVQGWRAAHAVDAGRRWQVDELDDVFADLLSNAAPNVAMDGTTPRPPVQVGQ